MNAHTFANNMQLAALIEPQMESAAPVYDPADYTVEFLPCEDIELLAGDDDMDLLQEEEELGFAADLMGTRQFRENSRLTHLESIDW